MLAGKLSWLFKLELANQKCDTALVIHPYNLMQYETTALQKKWLFVKFVSLCFCWQFVRNVTFYGRSSWWCCTGSVLCCRVFLILLLSSRCWEINSRTLPKLLHEKELSCRLVLTTFRKELWKHNLPPWIINIQSWHTADQLNLAVSEASLPESTNFQWSLVFYICFQKLKIHCHHVNTTYFSLK